jgi:acetyl-CoA acetyltransferase
MFKNAYIPYGGYYSTPFCKWQGSLQSVNSIELGGATAKRWFEAKGIDQSKELDYLYMGITNGQQRVFYGATWLAHMMGAGNIPGNTIMHACATSTTTIYNASLAVETGNLETAYCLLVDRMSNGPHTIWPNPQGPGGEVISENWNMDNINCDPSTGFGMIVTAENVARENGFTKAQADELTLRRYEQYADSLKDDRAFQKKYMFPVELAISRKQTILVEADEGVTTTSKEAIEKLRPTTEGGIHSFANQTHPADGNAGVIVTTKERAAQFSTDKSIPVQVISYGCVRTKKAFMPAAPAPAAKLALQKAGLTINDIKTIKNHNPFIANDLFLAKELGIDAMQFNNYGSSLVFGHPQAPTLARHIIEAIEETVLKGGGYALVTGCAAGDSAACLIVKVG